LLDVFHLQTVIPQCYDVVLNAVRSSLHSRGMEFARFLYHPENDISLTSDLWTDVMLRSFICLTGHFIDESWHLQSTLMNIYSCTDRHTGDNLAEWLVGLLNKMQIDV